MLQDGEVTAHLWSWLEKVALGHQNGTCAKSTLSVSNLDPSSRGERESNRAKAWQGDIPSHDPEVVMKAGPDGRDSSVWGLA